VTLAVCVLLAAAPVDPVRVAVPGLVGVGVEPALASALTERLVVLARREALTFITSRDIATILSIERHKQLLGCGSSDCMAELADALGAEVLLRGDLIHAGDTFTLVVKALRARDGRELVSDTVRAKALDQIQDWIEANASRFPDGIVEQLRGHPTRGGPSWLRFATLAAAAAVAGSGGLLLGLAYGQLGRLVSPEAMTPEQIDAAVADGRAKEISGIALLAVGGALAVVSAVLFAVYDPGTQFSVALLPGGAAVGWVARWP
jgi:hypothetical protein